MKKKMIDKGKTAAVAAVTAASMLVGGAFSSPEDLLDSGESISYVCTQNADDDAGDEEYGENDENKGRRLFGVRKLVMNLPVWVRAAVCLPLWLIGTALIWILGTVSETFIEPLLGQIGGWIAMMAVIVASFYLAVKSAFPDLKVKNILNKKTVPLIAAMLMAFAVADSILPLVWDDYRKIVSIFRMGGSLLSLAFPLALFLRRETKRRSSLPPEEKDLDKEMRKTRREVLAMVDSIK